MRVTSVLSLGVAITLGGFAAYLSKGMMQTGGSEAVALTARTAVVAAQPLQFGVQLTSDNLREIPWPSENIPEGAFTSVQELLKDGRRVSLANFQRDEPILSPKITGPNQRAVLSTIIEEGMRAVSVRVDEVRGVAGFILPGDRVDVILTRGETGMSPDAASADVLVQNTKVLAIDQLADERQEKPTIAKAVTLELDIHQAQKVILAQGIGKLSLILRQAGQSDAVQARRVSASDLGVGDAVGPAGKANEVVEAKGHEKPAAVMTLQPMVNVIRNGNKREQYTVQSERK